MKKIFSFKNILFATLAAFALMAVIAFNYDGRNMVVLEADGNYSYPDFCKGHEDKFLVNANSPEYQKGLYVAPEYAGDKGDFAFKNLALELSNFDQTTNSFYNQSLNLGFKLPENWEFVSPTPLKDDEYTYLYDFGAVSPDRKSTLVVKYHDLKADGIKLNNFVGYYDYIEQPYYKKGYRNYIGSNIFVADNFCHSAQLTGTGETGELCVAWQILDKDYVMLIELHSPSASKNKDVWNCFYSI